MSPGQVGLLNGWGVFSTIRVYDGVLFSWERHFERMKHDAAVMRVPFPDDADGLQESLHSLIDANEAWNATLRVCVIRNKGGVFEGPGISRDFDVVAFTTDVYKWNQTMRLGMVPDARHAASEFAGVKVLSWAQNLTWYERAHELDLDEMVLLNERGELSECTSANIFIVQGNKAWTPPLRSGCLPGVTRAVLLEELRAGVDVCERTLFPADLEAADEVFLTSTTRELLPVVSIEGLNLKQPTQSVLDRLRPAFTECVRSYVNPRIRVAAKA